MFASTAANSAAVIQRESIQARRLEDRSQPIQLLQGTHLSPELDIGLLLGQRLVVVLQSGSIAANMTQRQVQV
jgi:hypothetical protein